MLCSLEGSGPNHPMRYFPLLLLASCLTSVPCLATIDDALTSYFEDVDGGAAPLIDGERLNRPGLLSKLYRDREYRSIWTADGPLAGQLDALLDAIERSTRHGLNPADYHLAALERLDAPSNPHDELLLELLASDAFLGQVKDRATGAVSPAELDPDWHVIDSEADPGRTLDQLAASGGAVLPALDALWPQSAEYGKLVAERARILALGQVEMVSVPPGPLLRPVDRGARVVLLKQRLLGPGQYSDSYDDTLKTAVVDFQRAAGLEPDGIVGEGTLEVLNATRSSWIDRIDANLERWRWLPRGVPDTYLRVNIADFDLRVIRHGDLQLSMAVIVGKPYRRTPVFTAAIAYMVFNPYWTVPAKLAVQDKLPVLRQNPATLAAQGFEVRPQGAEEFEPLTAVDWSAVTPATFHYLLRQRPGPLNALGQVKLMLPNPYSVYLHDTPSRDLFAKQERSFSSGCVRLSRPLDLARWVLDNDGQATSAERVRELAEGSQTVTVTLHTPLPAYIVYFTAFTDTTGRVVFRRDLYQRDAALVAALHEGPRA